MPSDELTPPGLSVRGPSATDEGTTFCERAFSPLR